MKKLLLAVISLTALLLGYFAITESLSHRVQMSHGVDSIVVVYDTVMRGDTFYMSRHPLRDYRHTRIVTIGKGGGVRHEIREDMR